MRTLKLTKIAFVYLLLTLFTLFQSCQDDKIVSREYPRVDMNYEVLQDASGVSFMGTVLSEGKSPTIEKGFVWGLESMPTIVSSKISVENPDQLGEFNATTNFDFEKNKTYYVRAYARSAEYLVYSKQVTFISQY